jgi:hypothetical protein
MASSNGSASAAPAPRNNLRREICFLGRNIPVPPNSSTDELTPSEMPSFSHPQGRLETAPSQASHQGLCHGHTNQIHRTWDIATKRRRRVVSLLPNAASCSRLASAQLTEIDNGWMTGKIYMTLYPTPFTPESLTPNLHKNISIATLPRQCLN